MKQYLDIVKKVLYEGKWKSPVRKNHQTGEWEPVDGGVRTLACANVLFSHDMQNGFPLLTTKKMAWKSIRVELEGFIGGVTSKRWYQERGCKIWNEWGNPEVVNQKLADSKVADEDRDSYQAKVDLRKKIQAEENDLGPIYGFQWRNFDGQYSPEEAMHAHFGTDQLKNIVETLKNNPMDRRMVCSAWNPNQIYLMALPPCHWGWNVTVINNELNLFWVQRSCDLMLGVPFNIASYGLLLCLLAQVGGFKRGNLSGMLVDCHIYENQITSAWKQITREPQPLPTLWIKEKDSDRFLTQDADFNIFDWEWKDIILKNYNPLDKIDFGKVTV